MRPLRDSQLAPKIVRCVTVVRRHGLFALVAVLVAAGPAAAVVGEREPIPATTWTIGNSTAAADFVFTDGGRLVCPTLRDRSRNLDWAATGRGGLGFRVVVRSGDGSDPSSWEPVELTESSHWTLVSASQKTSSDGTQRLDFVLDSFEAPVRVTWSVGLHPESPVFRSNVTVASRGARVRLDAVDGLDAGLAGGTLTALTVNNFNWGAAATSFQTSQTTLKSGVRMSARTGPTGFQAAWTALRSASWNAGVFAGWEWSGPGLLEAEAASDGTHLSIGFAPGTFAHDLAPGASFAAPAAFLGTFSGSFDAAGAATRAFVTRRIAPPLPAANFPWVGFDTWGYSLGLADWQVETLIDRTADLGGEFFTLDAGWAPRLGDWWADTTRYANGLKDVSAHAHEKGVKFGLWIALGAADPLSDVVTSHPDWVAKVGGVPVPTDFGGVALCLGDARVRTWILAQVDRLAAEASLDWLVHDFTVITGCDDPGHGHQTGDGWWASTAGYYAVLDEIRKRHPKLVLENCWDGGVLMDFGMVARHDTSATSDRNDAYGNQRAIFGGSYFLPPRYLDKYVGDDGSADAYRFLSAVPGGPMILMGVITGWSDATDAAARAAVELFKQNRALNRDGAVYHLTGQPGSGPFTAIESYDAKAGTGVITVWAGAAAASPGTSSSTVKILPVGLSTSALYDVTVTSGLPAGGRAPQALPTDTGANLMSSGITVPLASAQGAAYVLLTRR